MKEHGQSLWQFCFSILKRVGLPLFFLTLAYTFFDQQLTSALESAVRNSSSAIWIFGFLSFTLSLVWPLLITVLIVRAAFAENLVAQEQIRLSFEQIFIESLRSWGQALFWSLLLIVPGLIRYLQLIFVPFVVLLDPQYQEGKVDALSRSAALVNRNFFKVLGFIFVFSIGIPLLLVGLTSDYRSLLGTPGPALLLVVLDTLMAVFVTAVLLRLYQTLKA